MTAQDEKRRDKRALLRCDWADDETVHQYARFRESFDRYARRRKEHGFEPRAQRLGYRQT